MFVGIYFKKNNGGVICYYTPDDTVPTFWYFKSGDSIRYISKKFKELTNHSTHIVTHINDIKISGRNQLNTYHQVIGMLSSLEAYGRLKYKITSMDRCKSRTMSLLSIKTKKQFITKLILKKQHHNQYNMVWEITNTMSNQSITNYRNAYLLAYYGYLKEKVHEYNSKSTTSSSISRSTYPV